MGRRVRSLPDRPFGLVLSSWSPVPRFFAATPPTDRFRLRSLLPSFCRALIVAGMLVMWVPASAQAVQVTSLPGSTLYPIPAEDSIYRGPGPKTVAAGITWTSESTSSTFGYTGSYGFESNGDWNGLSMTGTNGLFLAMTLTFDSPVQGVGAFLNWSRKFDGTPEGGLPVIAIYDAASSLLESYTLTFITGGALNSGEFHGFLRGSADIKSITFSGAYMGAANLEVVTVPEPDTHTLMLAGLGVLGLVARRRRGIEA